MECHGGGDERVAQGRGDAQAIVSVVGEDAMAVERPIASMGGVMFGDDAGSSTRLRFVDFVHPPAVAALLAEAIAATAGVRLEMLAVRDTVSAPGEAEALRLFQGGMADVGIL
mmetsp:Transcript_14417/g.50132  ORF Transcript_14417/g.50132 Transcript_14417/m.50132 type:complete len:113 (-) Transcript_14417:640-978(-)